MEQKTLTAAGRTELRTGASRRLRRQGRIPAVIYGRGEPTTISIDAQEFSRAFRVISESQIIGLSVDGTSHDVLIKDYQEDLLTGRLKHIDFYEIEAGRILRTRIAIHVRGQAVGVREGGILEQPLYDLEIECLPKDIPGPFLVDVSELGVGDALHVSDLVAPEGVRMLAGADQTVVLVAAHRVEAEPVAAEAEEEAEEGAEEGAAEEAETEE